MKGNSTSHVVGMLILLVVVTLFATQYLLTDSTARALSAGLYLKYTGQNRILLGEENPSLSRKLSPISQFAIISERDIPHVHLLADGQFVYGPNVGDFDIAAYLSQNNSPLVTYADVIEFWSAYASVNPRVVLTIIEMQSGLVRSNHAADPKNPVGYSELGFEAQIKKLAIDLATNFYNHLYTYGSRSKGKLAPDARIHFTLADGSSSTLSAKISSGTYAVAASLAPLSNAEHWEESLSLRSTSGFVQTYRRLFPNSDPWDTSNQINPFTVPPSSLLQFPFPVGSTWWFNGPHNWNGAGHGPPFSSMDFGTEAKSCTLPPNGDWAVAAASGTGYHPNGHGCWFRIDHGNGWATSYYHLRNVRGNGNVSRNNPVGTIACELCAGGDASAPHVHFSLLYHGAYVNLDGVQLSGWTIHSGDGSYTSGYIERNGQKKVPREYVYNDGISGGSNCPAPELTLPSNGTTINNRTVSFQWNAPNCAGLDVYTFRVADHPDIDNPPWIIDHGVVPPSTRTTENIPSEYEGKTLYWAVWAHNSAGYGPKGGPWTFRIDTSAPPPPPPIPAGAWKAEYFNGTNFESKCAPDSFIDQAFLFYDWGDDAPANGCNADRWSARFSKRVYFPGGTYTFGLGYDDGARIRIDGDVKVNGWAPATQHYETYYIPEGEHDVVIEFYDNAGWGLISAWWTGPGFDVPRENRSEEQWYAEYWGNMRLWWDSPVRVNEGYGPLNKTWGNDGPPYGLPSDRFSARFRRKAYFKCGRYRFTYGSDDGMRFKIGGDSDPWWDDSLWNHHGYNPKSMDRDVSEGTHEIQVEFFEDGGWAQLSFDWELLKRCAPSRPTLTLPPTEARFTEGDTIKLTWTGDGEQYWAEYGKQGQPASAHREWNSETQWQIGPLDPGYVYHWRVKARNGTGSTAAESAWSDTWTFTVRPATPADVRATATSCDTVQVTWRDTSEAEDGFNIYRDGHLIGHVGANTTSYTDTGLSGDTTYTYIVTAVTNNVESFNSGGASVSTPSCETPNHPPNVPTQLSPPDGSTHTSMPQLCWQDNGDPDGDAVEFRVTLTGAASEQSNWITQTCWQPSVNASGSYSWHVEARDDKGASSGNSSEWTFTVTGQPGTQTVTRSVASSEDDTSVRVETHDNLVREKYVRLGRSGYEYVSGFRFTNVSIPRGARIIRAHLEFTYFGWLKGLPIPLAIYGESVGNASSFTDVNLPASQRPSTSAGIRWTISSEPSGTFSSPDISNVIQEIINRDDWAPGNAIALLIYSATPESGHYIDVRSYDFGPSSAARLVIEYENAGTPVTPTPMPTPVPTPPPNSTTMAILPTSQESILGSTTITANVVISNVSNLGGFQFTLTYDPAVVHVEDVTLGDFLGSTGRSAYPLSPQIDNTTGRVTFGGYTLGSQPGASGSGTLAVITFSPQGAGETDLTLQDAQVTDTTGTTLSLTTQNGHLTVTACPRWDVDCDGDVDVSDIMQVAAHWNCKQDDACYDSKYDIDQDGDIDVADIMQVAAHWNCTRGDVCYGGGAALRLPHEKSVLSISLPSVRLSMGEEAIIPVRVKGANHLGGLEFTLAYDPRIIEVTGVEQGGWDSGPERRAVMLGPQWDEEKGRVRIGLFTYGEGAKAEDSGDVLYIHVRAIAEGASPVSIIDAQVIDMHGDRKNRKSVNIHGGQITVLAKPRNYLPTIIWR